MIQIKTVNIIDSSDFDKLVEQTYGRPYCFQQQDDCKDRGIYEITVPDIPNDYENDSVPDKVNGDEMGVSFSAWLKRDPKLWYAPYGNESSLRLFWYRNFYPDIQMVVNDLNNKGLLPSGEYSIKIDW